jgi:hypothetical protein
MPKCGALWPKQALNRRFQMSGFMEGVRFPSSNNRPSKCLILKGWNCQKAKPDKITAGLEGWNQEPLFNDKAVGGQKSTAPFLRVIRLAEWGVNGRLGPSNFGEQGALQQARRYGGGMGALRRCYGAKRLEDCPAAS